VTALGDDQASTLKDIAQVGGWVVTATLLKCYIATDEDTQEEVILLVPADSEDGVRPVFSVTLGMVLIRAESRVAARF
jgi:hypothetical protein